jgi:hypothetical protein
MNIILDTSVLFSAMIVIRHLLPALAADRSDPIAIAHLNTVGA